MSDDQSDSPFPDVPPADPTASVRAEVQREYAAKLAAAELRTRAAKDGITLPDGFTDFLDSSKLLGEDGSPSVEAIGKALAPWAVPKEPEFTQLKGAGHYARQRGPALPTISLDVRNR
ncbi:hypothetical protein GCM10010232_18260 [Streptomyces amakusaensis]|uniref:Uncharacterized protein n=1 Tax=Streptomyces amakusaensis TaxID=67271 RepID=A0ABW0AQG3_9ACTN